MKHHLFSPFESLSKKRVRILRGGVSLFAFVVAFFLLAALANANNLFSSSKTHDAELSFAEISSNPKVQGSVVPASCQSYQTVGPTHAINGGGGHCVGTCTAGYTINVRPYYRECTYTQNTGGGIDDFISYHYIEKFANESCPSRHPDYNFALIEDTVIDVPLCTKLCANGTWAYPHLGITCPAAPSVQIFFN